MARNVLAAVLMIGLITSSGCCWWAEHWCPHCQQPVMVQPVGYAPGCGCPTAAGYTPPPGPAPTWTAPQPPPGQVHAGCTCTCPQ